MEGEGGAIPVRNIHFDIGVAPRGWHGAGPGPTAFYDALSASFPLAERFFIRAVKRALPAIDDPALIEAVKAFCGQESMHAREHEAYNARLRAFGHDVDGMERAQARRIDWIEKDLGPEAALGITASLEHMTSILAAQIIADDAYFAGSDPAMREFWVWHTVEEAEHGAVAFEALQAMRPGYFFRVRMMLIATWLLLEVIARNLRSVMKTDRAAGRKRGLFRYLYVSPGLGRRILLPYLAFFRPGFHPSNILASGHARRKRALYDAMAAAR